MIHLMRTGPLLLVIAFVLAGPCRTSGETPRDPGTKRTATQAALSLTPYLPEQDDLWNRLHLSLFVRTDHEEKPDVHLTDPLFYRGGTFLLENASHHRAVALLKEFLAEAEKQAGRDRLKRLLLQRDLWAAFDYAAWYPDDWVHRSKYEPAAIAFVPFKKLPRGKVYGHQGEYQLLVHMGVWHLARSV